MAAFHRVAAKEKLDRNQRILAMLTANLTRTPFSITPPSTGLPTKTESKSPVTICPILPRQMEASEKCSPI